MNIELTIPRLHFWFPDAKVIREPEVKSRITAKVIREPEVKSWNYKFNIHFLWELYCFLKNIPVIEVIREPEELKSSSDKRFTFHTYILLLAHCRVDFVKPTVHNLI